MPAITYLKKKIGKNYLVWFGNSNLYFLLEQPAWFVFARKIKRHSTETIAQQFSRKYQTPLHESLSFVTDIILRIKQLNQTVDVSAKSDNLQINITENADLPYSVHYYSFGHQMIRFAYATEEFEYWLHPLICHFGINDSSDDMTFFELLSYKELIIFRFNGEVKGAWSIDETHLIKGMIFMFLINVMHQKTEADWLMTVHASAITNEKKTILFSAAPGNGKTTMAALLQSRGYHIISDDFVPIDRETIRAYPFPIAMSVKEGSMELLNSLMPTLDQQPLHYISSEKSVRYFTPERAFDSLQAAFPVHEFVFIKFDPAVEFVWEKLDALSGVRHLLDQAWVSPGLKNAKAFFEAIVPLNFYQLTYSNNEKALEVITNLFEHD